MIKKSLIGLFSPELTVAPSFFAKLVTLNLLGRTPDDRSLPQELLSNRREAESDAASVAENEVS